MRGFIVSRETMNLLTVAALYLLLVLAPARAVTYEDIDVTLLPEPKDKSSHGYFEYVFLVTNRSAERPHTVTLSVPDQKSYTGSDYIRELRRTVVQVGPKETVRVALLQPDYPHLGGEDVAVFLDERRQEYPVVLRPNATQHSSRYYFPGGGFRSSPGGVPEPLVLKSPSIRKNFPVTELPPGPVMGGIPGRRSGMRPPVAGPGGIPPVPRRGFGRTPPGLPTPAKPGVPAHPQFTPAQPIENWSTDWLAYSRYDGIVVRGDDLKAMTPDVRTALWQYVETGGSLLVLGDADLRGLSVSETKQIENGWRLVEAGFGRCIVSPDDDFDQWK